MLSANLGQYVVIFNNEAEAKPGMALPLWHEADILQAAPLCRVASTGSLTQSASRTSMSGSD
jgi:hypothetical protein